jgi:hypothetical protein
MQLWGCLGEEKRTFFPSQWLYRQNGPLVLEWEQKAVGKMIPSVTV